MKQYFRFNPERVEGPNTLLHVVQILLRGIARHVVDYDSEHYARFRRDMQDISESFDESQAHSELLFLAGSAVKALDSYNEHAINHFDRQHTEFSSMIGMLTETVASVSPTDVKKRLLEIQQLVSSAKEVSDLRAAKTLLGDCLAGVRKEVSKQQTESENATQVLLKEIERLKVAKAGSAQLDAPTALPSREAAESAIAARCTSGKPSHVAILIVDHLQLYNGRFGRLAGDNILRHFAESIRKLLPPQDALFRWSGPTLIALLDRSCSVEATRLELKRLLDKIPKISIESETRTALLSLSSRYNVFSTNPGLQLLIKQIDTFTNVQAGAAS